MNQDKELIYDVVKNNILDIDQKQLVYITGFSKEKVYRLVTELVKEGRVLREKVKCKVGQKIFYSILPPKPEFCEQVKKVARVYRASLRMTDKKLIQLPKGI